MVFCCGTKYWAKIKYMVLYGIEVNIGKVVQGYMNYDVIASFMRVCIYLSKISIEKF